MIHKIITKGPVTKPNATSMSGLCVYLLISHKLRKQIKTPVMAPGLVISWKNHKPFISTLKN